MKLSRVEVCSISESQEDSEIVSANSRITEVQKDARNHARALLTFLKINPSPAAVSTLTQQTELTKIGVTFTANGKDYQVLSEENLNAFFEFCLLKNPKSLPSKFLAVFLQGLTFVDRTKLIDFHLLIELADLFKRDDLPESNFLLHQIIAECPDLTGKIKEVLGFDFESEDEGIFEIAKVFGFLAAPEMFNGAKFWIFEYA